MSMPGVIARVRDGAQREGVRSLALLAALLAACGVPQPTNEEVPAPDGAAESVAIAVAEWSDALDERLAMDDVPLIRWFEGACLDYGDGQCTPGAYQWTPLATEIHIIRRPTIHESSLAHELLHWSFDERGQDVDTDHSRPLWAGVPAINDVLVLAGF
jgi:hypothetical protein